MGPILHESAPDVSETWRPVVKFLDRRKHYPDRPAGEPVAAKSVTGVIDIC